MSKQRMAMLDLSGSKTIIIAEIAQAHDGSLGMAHAYIDAVSKAGVDAVKFQTHIAKAESTPDEPWRIKFSPQDDTRFDYWKRMEFTEGQWHRLRRHADECGLAFLSSPFSRQAVELLKRVGVAAWKIASGEVTNTLMFESLLESKLPILLSTGMSSISEIDDAVARIRKSEIPFAVLQCTSMYPTPYDRVGVNMIPYYRARYDSPSGLSDHSGDIYAGLAATSLGAEVLEVHVTFSREMFGPDVPASITTDQLRQLVIGIRAIETMRANPVDKDQMAEELGEMRRLFTKSIVAKEHLPAGTILRQEHLTVKKPGTGIPADRLPELIGRELIASIEKNHQLREEDVR